MEPFKNAFNREFYDKFLTVLSKYKKIDRESFLKDIFTNNWDSLELKERMRLTTTVTHKYLGDSVEENIVLLTKVIEELADSSFSSGNIPFMFIPDYVEVYGIDTFNTSVKSFRTITKYMTCEFAVRPFIKKYPNEMMKEMEGWAIHSSESVRRLASEGCRPRLPWAMALPEFKKNPEPIIPIINKLKSDNSLFVRKSVANNINDISKDNPNIAIDLIKKWIDIDYKSRWICKHGARTLLKSGNREVLELFGYSCADNITISLFKVENKRVSIGEDLQFSFKLENKSETTSLVRIEYAIYYQKANGTLSKKVYKISEREFKPGEKRAIERKQHFRVVTTRKLHKGKHGVSLIINGEESDKIFFKLV